MENQTPQIVLYSGCGVLYLKCMKCGKEVGKEAVPFPGKVENERIPRDKLKVKHDAHLRTCN